MKALNYRLTWAAPLLVALLPLLFSCTKEGPSPANAVLVSTPVIEFEATGAGEQMITIYADGIWTVECPEWIVVSPTEGVGTTDVIISVTDNLDGTEVDKPRTAELVFKGEKMMSFASLHVNQEGDLYRGVSYVDIAGLAKLEDKALLKMKDVLVVARNTAGVVISDGSGMAYMDLEEGQVGDILEIWGEKSVTNGFPSITSVGKLEVVSSGNQVSLPEIQDITAGFDDFKATEPVYVSVKGIFNGTSLAVKDNAKVLVLASPQSELGLQNLVEHRLVVKGFYAGIEGSTVYFIVMEVTDKGSTAPIIWFEDDFSWLKPYKEAWEKANPTKKVLDCVGDGKSYSAYNLADPESPVFAPMGFWDDFTERGYDDIVGQSTTEGGHNSIYIQPYYLKFGRTDVHNGLKLTSPLPGSYAGQDVVLQFDWCAHCDKNLPADNIQLVIEVVGNGQVKDNGTKKTAPIFHKQSKDVMEFFWQNITVNLSGLDQASTIFMHPLNYKNAKDVMPTKQRWYIDNIKVYSYPDDPEE